MINERIDNNMRKNKKGKFGKLLLGATAVTAVVTGAYYVYKNFINKDYTDDFDDFDDELDEEFFNDLTSGDVESLTPSDDDEVTREYVSINISGTDSTTSEDTDSEVESVEGDSTEMFMEIHELIGDNVTDPSDKDLDDQSKESDSKTEE